MREFFESIPRNEEIVTDRNSNHGQEGIFVEVRFDEINIRAFDQSKIDNFINSLVRYKELRKKQVKFERELDEVRGIERLNAQVKL